ncbi:hypothetical protein A0J48_022030 [Sphaerospermopsis aphanizomenoides BCCUSP55]|uniref:hypothetical protein n=1 Tax=Sphaerospermopsis aphanizomenoides TaxID=459663 RepID=UPI000A993DEF|nr:hypothetical protein [Sphaerospermopsis aphanizomenoides]MBK1990171.1 hypothetical protein [Sphaerospermopsis aphanizomenoides BCCUSP55]
MSRLNRWLYLNRKKVNKDGTLNPDYINERLTKGINQETIDDYALTLKAEYERLKLLDETDPEPWINYTAYDFFTEEEKQQFNDDGSLKLEYVKYAHSIGVSAESLAEMERRKKIEVDNYNELSARYAEQGINLGEQQMQAIISNNKTYLQRRKQMEIDLRNFEDVDTLPFEPETRY